MKKVNLKKLTVSVITATAMALTVMAPTVFNSANIVNSRSITANAANIVMSEAEYQRGLHIYQYLKNHTSWNDGAICGILAHLYTESRFNPCVINKTSYAYGVAQWLGVRKNYNIKPIYKLTNAVVIRHEGCFSNLNKTIEELKNYIKKMSYQSITNPYCRVVRKEKNNMIIDIYIGLNCNIL